MHPNLTYRQASREQNIAFARERGFGILMMADGERPLASHLPFLLNDNGDMLEMHIVRSNPIYARLRDAGGSVEALLTISGPDGYISPDWYGVENQVPTWNYVAVHLRGRVSLLGAAALHDHLERLSASFENRLTDKMPWKLDKVKTETFEHMARMIMPISMTVEDVQGTWKFSQNKSDEARADSAAAVGRSSVGMETRELGRLMIVSLEQD